MRSILAPLALGAAVTATTLTGCSSATDSAAEQIAEATSGADVDIDGNGDEVTISTPDAVLSTSAELPDDFPDDVPVIDGTISSVSRTELDASTLNFVVSVTTEVGAKDAMASVTSDLDAAGWTQITKSEGDGGSGYGGLAGYEQGDDREVTVSVGPDLNDPARTNVQYIVTDRAAA